MKSLKEELRENFEVTETYTKLENYAQCTIVHSDIKDTHNKAIDNLIDKLKEMGIKKIRLPYLPDCYVHDMRDSRHKATVYMLKEKHA